MRHGSKPNKAIHVAGGGFDFVSFSASGKWVWTKQAYAL